MAAGNGLFVAVGEGICYSPDGQSWSGEDQHPLRNLNDVAYESSRFIATGSSGEMLTSDATPYTWTTRTSNTKNDLYGIAYEVTSKRLAAVGNGGFIVTSDNGNDWVPQNPGLLSIIYGNGRYVAVGAWGAIRTSLDG